MASQHWLVVSTGDFPVERPRDVSVKRVDSPKGIEREIEHVTRASGGRVLGVLRLPGYELDRGWPNNWPTDSTERAIVEAELVKNISSSKLKKALAYADDYAKAVERGEPAYAAAIAKAIDDLGIGRPPQVLAVMRGEGKRKLSPVGAAEMQPVAMEPEHGACEDTCKGCGGLSSYVEQVQSALVELGAPDPASLIAKNNKYVRGARKAGMSPGNAAGMIIGLSGSDPTSYTPRYQLEEAREAGLVWRPHGAGFIADGMGGHYLIDGTRAYWVDSGSGQKIDLGTHGSVGGAMQAARRFDPNTGRMAAETANETRPWVLKHQYGTPDGEFQVHLVGSDKIIGAVALIGKLSDSEMDGDIRKVYRQNGWVALPDARGGVDNTPYDDAWNAARAVYKRYYDQQAEPGAADAKFERCVQHVKTDSPDVNPWAACHAALGREPEPYDNKNVYWHRDGAGYYTDVDPYGRIRVKQRTQDKRNGKLAWFAVVKKVEVVQGETRAEVNAQVEEHLRKPRAEAAAGEDCIRLVPRGDVDVIERDPSCAPKGVRMDRPKDVAAYMKDGAARSGHEQFFVIGISKQRELVGQPVMVNSGQVDKVTVGIPQVVAAAAKLNESGAASIACAHFHPSGHGADPSPNDRELTKRIKKALDAADIPFDFHVVVAHNGTWARA